MNDFRLISIKRRGGKVEIKNPTQFELIGKGLQGAVFKLSGDRCVKIYYKEKYRKRESTALMRAKDSKIVPRVFEVGSNYIVMSKENHWVNTCGY